MLEKEPGASNYLKIIQKRLQIILPMTLVAVFIAFLTIQARPPQYRSVASLNVVHPEVTIDMLFNRLNIGVFRSVAQSPDIFKRLSESLKMDVKSGAKGFTWEQLQEISKVKFQNLRFGTQLQPPPSMVAGVMDLVVTGPDPQETTRIANQWN